MKKILLLCILISTAYAVSVPYTPYFELKTINAFNTLPYVYGGAVIDFNSDGYPDIVMFQGEPGCPPPGQALKAYQNNKDGTFTDVTDRVFAGATMQGVDSYVVEDFNGDGKKDILLTNGGLDGAPMGGEQMRIFIQTADGRLVDETSTRLPIEKTVGMAVSVADIAHRGCLDIFLDTFASGENGPRFLINDGTGHFVNDRTRLPKDISTAATPCSYGILVDIRNNGLPDLVLGEILYNEILTNDGTGHFYRGSNYKLPAKLGAVNELGPNNSGVTDIKAIDVNGDGYKDIIMAFRNPVTQFSGIQVLLNNKDGTFTDITASAGFNWTADDYIYKLEVIDANADGRPDILAYETSASYTGPRLFLNNGDGTFTEATNYLDNGTPLNAPQSNWWWFTCIADFNQDGVPDVFMTDHNIIKIGLGQKVIGKSTRRTLSPLDNLQPILNNDTYERQRIQSETILNTIQ